MSQASSLAQPTPKERNKYQSPPPPPSSMTPPPSSRALQPSNLHTAARTPTPTQSHLSSPPPTVKTPPPHALAVEPGTPIRLADDNKDASVKDLHFMLADKTAECRTLKASAAHHRLQYELLSMEFAEATNRFEVELDMAQKEVDVLQRTRVQHMGATPWPVSKFAAPSASPPDNIESDLKDTIRVLEADNDSLRRRLSDAKLVILERETVLAEENELLRQRIRENREHFNHLRQAGAIAGDDQSSGSAHRVPFVESAVPFGSHYKTPSKPREVEPFAALLLADQVLSQEAATTPSTPVSKPIKRNRTGHIRGPHSIASLPSTPYRSAPGVSAQKAAAGHYSHPHPASSPLGYAPTSRHSLRRRESRDSTISASDGGETPQQIPGDDDIVPDSEDEVRVTSPSISDEDVARDVYASQASQEAANMLRKSSSFPRHRGTPVRSDIPKLDRPAASSPTPTSRGTTKAARLSESKAHEYHAAKTDPTGMTESNKKRYYNDGERDEPRVEDFSPSKKAKSSKRHMDSARVGLGIDTWVGVSR